VNSIKERTLQACLKQKREEGVKTKKYNAKVRKLILKRKKVKRNLLTRKEEGLDTTQGKQYGLTA